MAHADVDNGSIIILSRFDIEDLENGRIIEVSRPAEMIFLRKETPVEEDQAE